MPLPQKPHEAVDARDDPEGGEHAPDDDPVGHRVLPESEVALTTNGALLAQQAEALAAAGLGRVTVSLDSLDDERFGRLNDVDFPVARVIEGIEADPRLPVIDDIGSPDVDLSELADLQGTVALLREVGAID